MKRILAMQVILYFFSSLLPVTPSRANSKDSLAIKVDDILKKYKTKTGPGCAVSIIQNGKVIFKKGYGIANLEYGVPISPSTVFDICSVSKQFTGFAISTLIEEGKISEDDDIRKYLPEVPQLGKTITIRHLLHHTSGLRDYVETLAAAGWYYDEMASFNDVMRMVTRQKELNFEPGSEWSYSNTGYNLLAAIVEKVTGQSFISWTDKNIFRPLNMRSSHFLDDYRKVIKNVAYSYYVLRPDSCIKNPSVLSAYGGGSLFSTAEDLSRWVIHFEKEVAAKNPVFLRMLQTDMLLNGKPVPYAYGLFIDKDHGLTRIWHPGSWAGYRAKLIFYPEAGLSLVLISNANDDNLPFQEIADLLLKDKFRPAPEDKISANATVSVDTSLLNKYAGIYQYASGTITMSVVNGLLYAQYSGDGAYPLEAKSDSVFWWPGAKTAFTFTGNENGQVNQFLFREAVGKRVELLSPPATDQLPAYSGIYYSEELGSEFTVDVVRGKLSAHHPRLGDFELNPHPFRKDAFTGFFGTFHFEKNLQQKVTGFKLSGNSVRNLNFNKIIRTRQD